MNSEPEEQDVPAIDAVEEHVAKQAVADSIPSPTEQIDPPRVFSENAIHMIRTAQLNTLTLSQMADQKASILMGATFLVFSLSISRSLAGEMPISLVLLAVFSFLSSVCAVIAVVPSVGKPQSSDIRPEKVDHGFKPNRLFFGHFAAIDESEWADTLLDDMTTDETVLRTMMHDLYQNGCVLQRRKYRFLALAYRIFIIGLLATLLVFGLEFIRAQ